MTSLARRSLGSSGIEVSELALGSWRTFERIPRHTGVSVMSKARELGITFLDDARYNDETGKAPVKSGYSEVLFGELFRASGWRRHEVVLANKLWWEFWPEQSAEAELDASLQRMGMDYIDLAYAEVPPAGFHLDKLVHDVGALIAAGKLRAWGVLNWPPARIEEAARIAIGQSVPPPCAAQLAYGLVRRSPVEEPNMIAALDAAGLSVVASFVLDGGALTGKYATAGAKGRLAASLEDKRYAEGLRASSELRALAQRSGATPAAMAIAFALLNPRVATVLFGATNPGQVVENVAAVQIRSTIDERTATRLRRIGVSA